MSDREVDIQIIVLIIEIESITKSILETRQILNKSIEHYLQAMIHQAHQRKCKTNSIGIISMMDQRVIIVL